MPIYEYVCESCGHYLEARQKLSDEPLTDCPNCRQSRLERIVSASNFSLKGGGWYADGYGTNQSPSKSPGASESKGTPADQKAPSSDKRSTSNSPSSEGNASKPEKKSAETGSGRG